MATAIAQVAMTAGNSYGPYVSGPAPSIMSSWQVDLDLVAFPLVAGSKADVLQVLVEESGDGTNWRTSVEATIGDNPVQPGTALPLTNWFVSRYPPIVTTIGARMRVTLTAVQNCTVSGSLSL